MTREQYDRIAESKVISDKVKKLHYSATRLSIEDMIYVLGGLVESISVQLGENNNIEPYQSGEYLEQRYYEKYYKNVEK